jgi:hypothetical protein
MQIERMVRLMSMEEHRDRDDREMGQSQGRDDAAPPREVEQSRKE